MAANVWEFIVEGLKRGKRVFLATLIERSGSSPRSIGSKMAVWDDGRSSGSIGGGSLEAFIHDKLLSMGRLGKLPFVVDYSMEAERLEDGMACGGRVKVLLEEIGRDQIGIYEGVLDALKRRRVCYLVKRLPPEKGVELLHEKPEEEKGVFVDAVFPKDRLIILGAGHIAFYLSKMASMCDFDVFVYDDRKDYATRERFPEAFHVGTSRFEGISKHILEGDYVVVATRSNLLDKVAISEALKVGPLFLGLVGSRRKFQKIVEELVSEGFDREALSKVRCPVGLNIGAETPCEMAVSIISELIKFRRSS